MLGRERIVANRLQKLDPQQYAVFNDVLLKMEDGKSSQVDHVVLSRFGIVVIETKNYKGWIYGNENSAFWTQVNYQRKDKFYNPIWQNKGHIKALQELLGERDSQKFLSIISFTERANLKKIDARSVTVRILYSSQVLNEIEAMKEEKLTKAEVFRYSQLLVGKQLMGKEKRVEHVESVKSRIDESNARVSKNICPKCGSALKERNGKYGRFLGCSGYPSCRFIHKN
ncbi:NERD domain-containing protein [Sutcliffiella halmapala]